MGMGVELQQDHQARPRKRGYSALLVGLYVFVTCAVFNVAMMQKTPAVSGTKYSVSDRTCMLSID